MWIDESDRPSVSVVVNNLVSSGWETESQGQKSGLFLHFSEPGTFVLQSF